MIISIQKDTITSVGISEDAIVTADIDNNAIRSYAPHIFNVDIHVRRDQTPVGTAVDIVVFADDAIRPHEVRNAGAVRDRRSYIKNKNSLYLKWV